MILFTISNSNPDVLPGFHTVYLATYWELPLVVPQLPWHNMAFTPAPPYAFPNAMHHISALRPKSRSQRWLRILSYPFQRVSYELCVFYFSFTFFPVCTIFFSILPVQTDWCFWKRILSLSLCLGKTITDLFILSLRQSLGYLKSQLNPWAWTTTGNIQSNLHVA